MEDTDKQQPKQFDWLKEYQWQKGQSGNPAGRPKGKTMKEWCREFLMSMSEEARLEFIKGVDSKEVWKMAEGLPSQDVAVTGNLVINIEQSVQDKYANPNTGDSSTRQPQVQSVEMRKEVGQDNLSVQGD